MTEHIGDMDSYIGSRPEDVRPLLESIRRAVHDAVPEAVETISYQMPTFKLDGVSVVHFAAWKDHIAVYPIPEGTVGLRRRLAPYVTGKGTVRFPLGEPIPLDLVRELVAGRVAELRSGRRPPG